MPTLTIAAADLTDLRPGDRITQIDGHDLARTVTGHRGDGAVRLANPLGSGTDWALYPDQVQDGVTVHRSGLQYDHPIGPELPVIPERTLKAIRRNGWWIELRDLATLTDADPRGIHCDRFTGMRYGQMGSHGYALTERGPGRRWRISLTGRLALAAYLRWAKAR